MVPQKKCSVHAVHLSRARLHLSAFGVRPAKGAAGRRLGFQKALVMGHGMKWMKCGEQYGEYG